jgi:hypothetical protein
MKKYRREKVSPAQGEKTGAKEQITLAIKHKKSRNEFRGGD